MVDVQILYAKPLFHSGLIHCVHMVTLIDPSSLVTSASSSASPSAEGELSFESIGD
jgi:hypothetical protein